MARGVPRQAVSFSTSHAIVLWLIVSVLPGHGAMSQSATQEVAGLDSMLAVVEAAQVALVQGNAEPFKALWSQADDVTLVGGLGGAIEKGWSGVSRRLDWVSTQYTEGSRQHEEVSRMVGCFGARPEDGVLCTGTPTRRS